MKEYRVKVYDDRTEWRNLDDELHRENGPAMEYVNGDKYYWKDGLLHRLDGPAQEAASGSYKAYFIEGKWYTEEQFLATIEKMKKPLAGTTIELDGVEYTLS